MFSLLCLNPAGVLQSPLHLATYLNLTDVVRDLTRKGASLELQDQDGNTALHVACQHGQKECASEMTQDFCPSTLEPVLKIQNWRGQKNARQKNSLRSISVSVSKRSFFFFCLKCNIFCCVNTLG